MSHDTIGQNATEPTGQPPGDWPRVEELIDKLRPGTRIGAHFIVTRPLGSGGMGLVLLARDEQLMRDVAIKFVTPGLLGDGEAQRRFLDEARAMARVRHTNVVEVFSFGEHHGMPYFAMEYVPGITADTWYRERMLKSATPPPIDEVLGIIEQCCRGTSAIHASGAIHGDLKPGNVLLGPSFRVALADLGLSRLLEHAQLGEMAGTPAYMAPETGLPMTRSELLPRRDVYSLGVMAYEFLTGQLPRGLRRVAGSTQPIQDGQVVPPSHRRVDLPAAFDSVLLSALAIDPVQRTASADVFRRELMSARRVASERKFAAKILVVDDDPDFLALVDRSLRASFPGAQLTCVADGARALDALQRTHFDLAIVDLRLPDVNGLELTIAIRAEEGPRRTPILIVTAHGGARDWQLLSSLGADSFLVKPVDPHGLSAMVGRLLEQQKTSLRP